MRRLLAGSPNGVNIAISLFGIVVLLTMLYRPQGFVAWVLGRAAAMRLRRSIA